MREQAFASINNSAREKIGTSIKGQLWGYVIKYLK